MAVEITRWRRFGHDRLYLKDGERQLGWWDLEADKGHPEDGTGMEDLAEAVWTRRCEILGGREQSVQIPPQAGHDIAGTVAGMSSPVVTPGPSFLRGVPISSAPSCPPGPEATSVEPRPGSPATPSDDDLMANAPAASLQPLVEQARAAGQRPTLLRRLMLGKEATSTWERGAVGETRVARTLVKVVDKDPRWKVIHSVPVGSRGSDIDHVVIGPGDVFTLNTKYRPRCPLLAGR